MINSSSLMTIKQRKLAANAVNKRLTTLVYSLWEIAPSTFAQVIHKIITNDPQAFDKLYRMGIDWGNSSEFTPPLPSDALMVSTRGQLECICYLAGTRCALLAGVNDERWLRDLNKRTSLMCERLSFIMAVLWQASHAEPLTSSVPA